MDTEEQFTKEEVMDGKTRIPIGAVFPFLMEYVSESLVKELGVTSVLDRNFLFLQQMMTREKASKATSYQCVQPLISNAGNGDEHLIVTSLQKHAQIIQGSGEKVNKDCFSLFYLVPKTVPTPEGLVWFHGFFQNVIRPTLHPDANFSHILKALYLCIKENQYHFSICSQDKTMTWAFYYNKGHLFIYTVPDVLPQPDVEKQVICRWISVADPIYERRIESTHHLHFSEFEIQEIVNDKEAKPSAEEVDGIETKESEAGDMCLDCGV